MSIINLGILAHVDAGKTSLTERLLFNTGMIDRLGSVDAGNTQTDTLALERQRGITIKAAVASFPIDELTVNLIDTPGHPDFIAEVERSLSVLDGAVLVISAVEGVQVQTRVLMRALQRLHIPTLIFVNKIDRAGAQEDRLLQSIAEKLTPAIIAMGTTSERGSRDAQFMPYAADHAAFIARMLDLLADRDESFMEAYLTDESAFPYQQLRIRLARLSKQALIHPVFFGSAITGVGIEALMSGIQELLPAVTATNDGPLSGSVFKIERGKIGEKIAYVRLFSGILRVRDRLLFGDHEEARVTGLSVFEHGLARQASQATAGQIAKLWGLGSVQIGDLIGSTHTASQQHFFAPPALETGIVPRQPGDKAALHMALSQLTEQDPLINLRQDDVRQELFLSLYGEVQKEVIQATLAHDFHIEVDFRQTTTICVERPVGSGAAAEFIGKAPNPFVATVGLRIEASPAGSGITFRTELRPETIPTYLFKSPEEFRNSMQDYVLETLQQGLYGWQVSDCVVTMTHSGFAAPATMARDYRLLTPLVLMAALQQADTVVCEPMYRFQLEIPVDCYGRLVALLAELRALPQTSVTRETVCVLEGVIPADQIHRLQQQLPSLTRGEGVLESSFDHYEPMQPPFPARPRTDYNPLNRQEYMLHLAKRA